MTSFDPTVGDVFEDPLFQAELEVIAYQTWEELKEIVREDPYRYACEECKVVHFRDSQIGRKHRANNE